MRRAVLCLLVASLTTLVFVGVACGGPLREAESRRGADQGLPRHRQHRRRRLRAERRIHHCRDRIRRLPASCDWHQLLPAARIEDHLEGLCDLSGSDDPEKKEPEACPKASAASPLNAEGHAEGRVYGVVAFGTTRVKEEAELFAFFKPGGGLEFFTFGHSPTTLEIPSTGLYTNLTGGGGFGPKFLAKVPLVETVPGAPYASVEKIVVKVGAAHGPKSPRKATYYGRVPKRCPKGYLALKSEVIFAEDGEESKPETVIAEYRAPCPGARKGSPEMAPSPRRADAPSAGPPALDCQSPNTRARRVPAGDPGRSPPGPQGSVREDGVVGDAQWAALPGIGRLPTELRRCEGRPARRRSVPVLLALQRNRGLEVDEIDLGRA